MGSTCSSVNSAGMGGKNTKQPNTFDSLEEESGKSNKVVSQTSGHDGNGETPYTNISSRTLPCANVVTSDVSVDDSTMKKLVPSHKDTINDIVLCAGQRTDGAALLTCSDDNSLALQRLGSEEGPIHRWTGHSKPVNKVVCNEKFIFSCSRDLKIKQ